MPLLSVVLPTYNERDNLQLVVSALASTLSGLDYEIVVVDDDSPDGTAALARTMAQQDPRVRVVQRIGRRGLASAVIEGALATSSPYIAVMDADLQHDERILPRMLHTLQQDGLDIVVGTRHAAEGGLDALGTERAALSQAGRRLFGLVSRAPVSDPMSGYFVMTREFFHRVSHSLSATGFKILVDLLASARGPVRVGEVPYTFRRRAHGQSKLDVVVALEYLQLLLDKWTRGWVPTGYLLFAAVGTAGMVFNFVVAAVFLRLGQLPFVEAQAYGALLTVAFNFTLNNAITFRAARLRGRYFVLGLLLFYLVCSVALVAQLSVSTSLQRFGVHWAPATIAGIVIASVWNYSLAAIMVWQINRRPPSRPVPAYDASNTATQTTVPRS